MKEIIENIKEIIKNFPKWLKITVAVLVAVTVGSLTGGYLVSCVVDYENTGTKLKVTPTSSNEDSKNLPSYKDIASCTSYSEVESLVKAYGFNSPEDFEQFLRDNNYIALADDFHSFVKDL